MIYPCIIFSNQKELSAALTIVRCTIHVSYLIKKHRLHVNIVNKCWHLSDLLLKLVTRYVGVAICKE